ncbi:DNA polymerase III subunit gamma and tau [Cryobacterium sp. TMT2-15-1]|uniref:DNA polymerase III subunit gamma and tau n=1 Tax=Cryobacterium sp. TMT2-15-1 TaxID=1259246 RepID=UPI00157FA1B9|nr:DNA polymerase III subunit gamma and tau [Cryobacterium sp. TMT2-15-1]
MVTALYRRYRPETFAEMIGQSQVTDPLMTALRTNRVNHAYLFSGPRGCGKTTSARILARCLNCAEGPTDTPCGVCPSCVELSRDGGGSLDVVEIDAASHNGVDDARDIRERAIFAPARDRYKIFILDEAHMVTPQGFNALLKIVEEPPEHVKFIFATTEPEKVIGTIRSRTHHYPFRLVPPGPMLEYVQQMCDTEQMTVAPGVLPLVVRAGGGSPRDTLSLLDQLMAGSDGHSVEYDRAVALLGYTNASLLDESIDAIADRDPSAAFDAVDRVVQTGQDPRRFVEDLLERLRDLIIVGATSAAAAAAVLRGVPQEELDRMAVQAAKFGPAELSRTADVINAALTEMTGATSPRLHLELMIARVLIPASDDSTRGALARVERLERRIGVGSGSGSGSDPDDSPATDAPATSPVGSPPRAAAVSATHASGRPAVSGGASGAAASAAAPAAAAPATQAAAPPRPVGPVTLQQVKDSWPQILEAVKAAKISAWLVLYTARAMELRGGDLLVLSFPSQNDVAGLKQSAAPGQGVGDYLKRAVNEVLGFTPQLTARVDSPRTDAPATPNASAPAPAPVAPVSPGSGFGVQDSTARSPVAQAATVSGSAAAGSGNGDSGSRTTPKSAATTTDEASPADADPDPAAADADADRAAAIADPDPAAAVNAAAGSAPAGVGKVDAPEAPAASTASPTVTSPTVTSPTVSSPTAASPTVTSRAIASPAVASPATGWATAAIPSPSVAGTGWATVAIPGSAPSAETAAPASDAFAGASAATPAATPDGRAHASAPRTVPRSTSSAPAPTTLPASGRDPEPQPPHDDEPPPDDEEFPPDLNPNGAQPGTPPRTQVQAPNRAGGAASVARRGPAFADKQRYGESVVREILGATFLEEQPHDPAPRTRGD